MKRLIYSSKVVASAGSNELQTILDSNGIDSSSYRYKMTRWVDGDTQTFKFRCKGDWLACFAMALLETPTPSSLSNYFGGLGDVATLARRYPNVNKLLGAMGERWALPDEYSAVIDLVNLDTGDTLWHIDPNEVGISEYEEDVEW